jgi:hypothetical protein
MNVTLMDYRRVPVQCCYLLLKNKNVVTTKTAQTERLCVTYFYCARFIVYAAGGIGLTQYYRVSTTQKVQSCIALLDYNARQFK